MNYKKCFGFVLLLVVMLGLAACDPPAPGRAPVDDSNLTPSRSGTEIEIVTGTPDTQGKNAISGYAELREGETIDMDFNGSGDEMGYTTSDSNGQRAHGLGQYVGDGGGIGLAPVSSIPSYATCKSTSSWYPAHSFDLGDIFCFETWDNTYGYIQIVKLKVEQNGDSGTPVWTVGFNYLVWIP
ncbi:MAG: hypothetical protein GXP40_10575 [Chloroflexi bacterium]|nr:hypothetical protein [Chloroflexota bacterium]